MIKPRARALGLAFPGTPGPFNAITDVPGVAVGMHTLSVPGDPATGRGAVNAGVTAILPRPRERLLEPAWAGIEALNGNGEMTGSHWVRDGGWLLGPILLTDTHSVGAAHHAAIGWMTERFPETFRDEHIWMLPVVAETYNGVLNDINAQPVGREHVRAALDAVAPGPVQEGQVGGGAGMIAYEFAGGSGTSSRVVTVGGRVFTVAAFVQANHGVRDWLTVLGVPVGRKLRDDLLLARETGSIIVVIATDAPLLPHQLRKVARRCTIGIGRGGSVGGNNSGDIFLAFTTANPPPPAGQTPAFLSFEAVNDAHIDPIYQATVQATEEAVINALVASEDRIAVKPAGRTVRAIRHNELMAAMRES